MNKKLLLLFAFSIMSIFFFSGLVMAGPGYSETTYPTSATINCGTYVTGSLPSSVQTLDTDRYEVRYAEDGWHPTEDWKYPEDEYWTDYPSGSGGDEDIYGDDIFYEAGATEGLYIRRDTGMGYIFFLPIELGDLDYDEVKSFKCKATFWVNVFQQGRGADWSISAVYKDSEGELAFHQLAAGIALYTGNPDGYEVTRTLSFKKTSAQEVISDTAHGYCARILVSVAPRGAYEVSVLHDYFKACARLQRFRCKVTYSFALPSPPPFYQFDDKYVRFDYDNTVFQHPTTIYDSPVREKINGAWTFGTFSSTGGAKTLIKSGSTSSSRYVYVDMNFQSGYVTATFGIARLDRAYTIWYYNLIS